MNHIETNTNPQIPANGAGASMTGPRLEGPSAMAVEMMIAQMQEDPRLADYQFRTSSTWEDGAKIRTCCAGYRRDGLHVAHGSPHELRADEPVALLGAGSQVGPTGHLLHALCHSLAMSVVYFAGPRGVRIDGLRISAEGCLDLQGLLALNDRVRPGFKTIDLGIEIDSPSPVDQVQALVEYAKSRSPIYQTITQPIGVDWSFEIETTDASPDDGALRHGVNAADLAATVEAIAKTPVLGKCRFFTSGEWLGGSRFRTTNPGFDQAEGELLVAHRDPQPKGYVGDMLTEMLGADSGPSPEEVLLHGLAACVSVTTSYHAAVRAIRLERFDVDFDGDVDMRGFADLDDRVEPGYSCIRGRVYLKANGRREDLEAFLAFTTAHSPMCNSVCQPVAVSTLLICNGRLI